jgi:molybdopterin molybdotransferase
MSADALRPSKLSFAEARHVVEEHARSILPGPSGFVGLREAGRRILAEPVFADRDFPAFARATRDGYAVRSADVVRPPALLDVIGEIKAGALSKLRLEAGQAAAIMTGAPLPEGADSVVMVEYTSLEQDQVRVSRPVVCGENVVPQAAEAKRGDCLLPSGTRLHYAAIGVAASAGTARLRVYRQPLVALLPTGDEVVEIEAVAGPSQIRNSNSYALAAQVERAGGVPQLLPVACDEPGQLRELIVRALEADLVVLSGGVSMGRYDLVKQVLGELRAEFFFAGVKIQPGGPVAFGRVRGKYFFALPGNPVSTLVTFELFARPLLGALAGMAPQKLRFLHARLQASFTAKTGLTRFLPAMVSGEFEDTLVAPVPWQGSGDLASSARSNCYLVVPPDRERFEQGEWMAVMPR